MPNIAKSEPTGIKPVNASINNLAFSGEITVTCKYFLSSSKGLPSGQSTPLP